MDQGEVTINSNSITIKKVTVDIFLMNIHIDELNEASYSRSNVETTIQQLLSDYQPQKTIDMETRLTLKEDQPIYSSPRRLSMIEREYVEKQIDEWLREGIIEPNYSEYASPVVIVKKKDDSSWLCVDYRKVKKGIVKDRYPLPSIDGLLIYST